MDTGIELIHKEPTLSELLRIRKKNWDLMSKEQKKMISDKKSIELFGLTNKEHFKFLLWEYIKDSDGRIEKKRETITNQEKG